MGRKSTVKKPKVLKNKICPMEDKRREVIEIDDSCPSSDEKGTPLRSIFCLKNRDQIKKIEEKEECFILEFNPYDDLKILNLSLSKGFSGAQTTDLVLVAEKGQVACRDYPHARHTCAKYPFMKTPHDRHCELCYCYVCDLAAPCKKWIGSFGHCHAFNNEAWNNEKRLKSKLVRSI